MSTTAKVTIIGGSGGVGSALAYTLLTAAEPYDIILLGQRSQTVECHLMDLEGVAPFGASTVRSGGLDDLADSNVIVITASIPFLPSASRADFLSGNIEVLRPYFRALAELPSDWDGYIMVVTNPVDPLSTWLSHWARIDRHRILGYSWNDSLRLRVAVARVLGVNAARVVGWVIGEHGDTCVPLFDNISVDGNPVQLSSEQQHAVVLELQSWYRRWTALRVSRTTAWTTASGVAAMIRGLARSTTSHWCAAVRLDGEYDIDGVAVGMPISINADRVPRIRSLELAPPEIEALHRSADLVRHRADQCGEVLVA
ncbi:MAG TPA: hypothetical protein VHX38_34545 [Pseudonocardiaceae bacterium]|nr:hypothetical protein [Pseudonocardiaceae bacterium]